MCAEKKGDLLALVSGATCVSFDIFDTAVVRRVLAPRDVFVYTARSYAHRYGGLPFDFAAERELAETAARSIAHGREPGSEITLDDIYTNLAGKLRLDCSVTRRLRELEIAAEKSLCVRNPFIHRVYEHALASGKSVFFTSDMYLPCATIEEILRSCGYTAWTGLLLSCQFGRYKRTGLYRHLVRTAACPPADILHIGDNHEVDVVGGREAGLTTWHYRKCADCARDDGILAAVPPTASPGEKLAESMFQASLVNKYYAARGVAADPVASFWYDLGYRCFGVFTLGFGLYLREEFSLARPDKVFFILRDGYVIKQVYDHLRAIDPSLPEAEYLYASRRVYRRAVFSRDFYSILRYFEHDCRGKTVSQALCYLGLDPADYADRIQDAGLCDLTSRLDSQEDIEKLADFCSQIRPDIEAATESARQNLLAYFRQVGLTGVQSASLVDIGWIGSIQSVASQLLREVDPHPTIRGYYVGIFKDLANSFGYLFRSPRSEHGEDPSVRLIRTFYELFDVVYTAPHGPLVGWQTAGDGLMPVFGNDVANRGRGGQIAATHAGILDFVRDSTVTADDLSVIDIPLEMATRPLARLVFSPTALESQSIGDIRYEAKGFEVEEYARCIARPPAASAFRPLALRTAYHNSWWKPGFVTRLSPPARAGLKVALALEFALQGMAHVATRLGAARSLREAGAALLDACVQVACRIFPEGTPRRRWVAGVRAGFGRVGSVVRRRRKKLAPARRDLPHVGPSVAYLQAIQPGLAGGSAPALPKISLVVLQVGGDLDLLVDSVRGLSRETYRNREILCLYGPCPGEDGCGPPGALRRLAEDDLTIQLHLSALGRSESVRINEILDRLTGSYVIFLRDGECLTPGTLAILAQEMGDQRQPPLVYTDELLRSPGGAILDCHYKPDFSPDLLLSQNYISRAFLVKTSVLRGLGGFRPEFETAAGYDLVLRIVDGTRDIHHVAVAGWCRTASEEETNSVLYDPCFRLEDGQKAIQATLARRRIEGEVEIERRPFGYRVRRTLIGHPLVSIVIPFRDAPELLRTCVQSIVTKSSYHHFEIIGISNNSQSPATFAAMEDLARLEPRVQFVEFNSPFNYSRINNYGARLARGEHLLLLNNDTEVLGPDWIECLLEHSQRPEIGAVGARLLYGDHTIEHAGVVLGVNGYLAHLHQHLAESDVGYHGRLLLTQNFSALMAACLMIKRDLYLQFGGLDERDLRVAYNDIDLCIRLLEAGFYNVYTPYCRLYHFESKSRGRLDIPAKRNREYMELMHVKRRHWRYFKEDPYYNRNLGTDGGGVP